MTTIPRRTRPLITSAYRSSAGVAWVIRSTASSGTWRSTARPGCSIIARGPCRRHTAVTASHDPWGLATTYVLVSPAIHAVAWSMATPWLPGLTAALPKSTRPSTDALLVSMRYR